MKRSKLSSMFVPYLAHESDQERDLQTLLFFLRTLFVVAVISAVFSILAGLGLAFLWSSIGAGMMVLLLALMRKGHPRAASILLIVTWQVIATVALATGDGIHDIAIIIFPAVLITASMLLPRALYGAMAIISVVAVVAVGIAEIFGAVKTPFSDLAFWGDVPIIAVILGCIALLIRFLTEALHTSLDHARRNEQNFRGVFNATREAIIIHDAQTGAIVDANDAFLTMTDLSREQAVALSPQLFYDRAIAWDRIQQTEDDEPEVLECDLLADGHEERRLEVTMRRSIIGDRDCVLAVARDITERRRLENRLRQSEKMQAVGQLAGGIAHDFNNQLVGIVGYADLLRVKLAGQKELAPFADRILRSARRASDLTAHLLAFARKGKFVVAAVDLHDIITEVVALLDRSIDKTIVVGLDLEASAPIVLGDPTQLQNCFLNLALNARDAMPDGGEMRFVTREVHLDEEDCRTSPHAISSGEYLEVKVSDTGIGMSRSVAERIFEPFFTTKEGEKGTGMGLAAVYGTIKNHKGAISVYSDEGCGTTFRVCLPLSQDAHTPLDTDTEAIPAESVPGTHILLVDDEEEVCDVTAELLRSLGHRVSVCRNGRDAVDLFRGSAGEINLVILDMIMPIMGGRATFEALREIAPSVRVLLSSGYSLEGEAQAVLDRGARGFVQKPFLKNELDRAIREALAEGA